MSVRDPTGRDRSTSTLGSIVHAVRSAAVPPHAEWAPFGSLAAIVALAGLVFGLPAVVVLGVALLLACLGFFRDPARVPPDRDDTLLAPADGVVTTVAPAVPPPELELGPTPRMRIATFLSVLDVHVNRMPATGTVRRVAYRPGRFVNASLDKASDDNERNGLVIDLPDGRPLAVVQIAGLIARRIVCDAQPGDAAVAGARFGLIRFGSRTDLYLPDGAVPLVRPGQRMVGGETVMAVLGPAPPPPAPTAATSTLREAVPDPIGEPVGP